VLGSTRPPKDATVRFCLPCSEERGRLVKRVAPALERKRASRAALTASKAQAKAERERQAKVAAVSAKVTDRDEPVRIDKLLERVWALPTRKAELPGRTTPPELLVRRGSKSYTTGHCWYGADYITVTVGRVDYAEAVGVVIHEAAHEIAYTVGCLRGRVREGKGHGTLFRSIFRSLVGDWTGVPVRDSEATDKYEFQRAMVHHLRDTC
jgi:hypothetical protein